MRLFLLPVLAGCILGPDIQVWSERPMEPPRVYAEWYAEVEACWGVAGDYSRVRWYTADKITLDGVERAGGLTKGDKIVIAWGYENSERHVKHEMSHHVSGKGDEIHYRDEHGRYRARCDA